MTRATRTGRMPWPATGPMTAGSIFGGGPHGPAAARGRGAGSTLPIAPWAAVAILALAACGARQTPRSSAPPPVRLRSPAVVTADFQWRQRVTVSYSDRAPRSFDAVLHKQGDRLALVGLTPLNTVTFVVRQVGLQVTFDNRTGESLPFDGRHILQDVQRVYFPWLEGDAKAGTRTGERLGERVTERLRGVEVVERTFEQPGRPSVHVVFEGLRGPGRPPARATLDNRRYDYRLTIETSDPAPPAQVSPAG